MFKVKIFLGMGILAEADYIYLEPNSFTTLRKFLFTNTKVFNDVHIDYKKTLTIEIIVLRKNGFECGVASFDIVVYDSPNFISENWWVEGLVHEDGYERPYSQGLIDVLHHWATGNDIGWFEFSKNSTQLKEDYIYACFLWSGIQDKIVKKDFYEIDFSKITCIEDLSCSLGEAFFGHKGYMGGGINAFEDCMIILAQGGSPPGIKIKLLNVITENYIYNYFRKIFSKYETEYKIEIT